MKTPQSTGWTMPLELERVRKGLSSPHWSERVAIQAELERLESAAQWAEIMPGLAGTSRSVYGVAARIVSKRLEQAEPLEAEALLSATLFAPSPLWQDEELSRQLLESALSSKYINYRGKVDILVGLLKLAQEHHLEPAVTPLIVRAMGYFRARRAITYLEELFGSEDRALILETVKALRAIGDPKAANFMERLFGHSDPAIVSASVQAYAELGIGWLRGARLYRLYGTSSPLVKETILKALLRVPPQLGAWIFERLYRQETQSSLKHQIVKSISFLKTERSGRFLLLCAAMEKDFRLRGSAAWCLGTFPALSMRRAIRRALRSDLDQVKRWGILKAAQLPAESAVPYLKRLALGRAPLAPVVRHSLIEAVGKLPESRWNRDWLLSQIHGDVLCAVSAVFVFLANRDSALLSIVREVGGLKPMSQSVLQSLLGCLAHDTRLRTESEVREFVERQLDHESFQVRYLSAAVLLRHCGKRGLAKVWPRALRESPTDMGLIASLIGNAITAGDLDAAMLPVDTNARELLRKVFGFIKPGAWSLSRWQAVIGLLRHQWEKEGPGVAFAIQSPVWEFLSKHQQFWGSVLNDMLAVEKDQGVISFLCRVAIRNPTPIRPETLQALLDRISNDGRAISPVVLELIGATRREELFVSFVEWLVAQRPESALREHGYRTLARWIDKAEARA